MAAILAFTDNFKRFSHLSGLIEQELPEFSYPFVDYEKFVDLLVADTAAGNRIYVQELLFRAHWAALSAIFRNRRWMAGMNAALTSPNYFSFCACLRGLLESAADSHEALYTTMSTLAEHFGPFSQALAARVSDVIIACEPLENSLIHYSHGRRIGKNQNAPATHRAKTNQEYLAAFEDPGSRVLRDLYAELCEVTHPAAVTVHVFGKADSDDPNTIQFVNPDDRPFIVSLLRRHNDAFILLFQKSFNAAFLTLYILNRFNDARFFTPGANQIDFTKVPAFFEINQKISSSQQSFG